MVNYKWELFCMWEVNGVGYKNELKMLPGLNGKASMFSSAEG